MSTPHTAPVQPTSTPLLKRVLRLGLFVAAGIALVGMLVGGLFAGWNGVTSALIGTAMATFFLAMTALSIVIANRLIGSDAFVGLFFGIVLGGWIVKFIVFIVLAIILRHQPWINPIVLFLSLIAAVVGSLVVDLVVIARARVPYVADSVLPNADRSENN